MKKKQFSPLHGFPLPSTMRPLLPWLFCIFLLVVFPLIWASNGAFMLMNQMAITIIFALAYNMLLGQGGMLSFGHAIYMGLGGFFAVHMMNDTIFQTHVPLPFFPLIGGVFSLFCGALIGLFSTQGAGTRFAMISLAIGELMAASSLVFVSFFGGEEGISADRTHMPAFFGLDFASPLQTYGLTSTWLIIAALFIYLFSCTPMGRLANAVRDNPERLAFLGYNPQKIRWISFCASSFFCGIAGSLFAINYEIVTEENLNLASSGTILLVTYLGGTGFFIGPVIGAIVFTLLQTLLSLYTPLWPLYLGLTFVLMVMYQPNGLSGLLALHIRPWRLGKLPFLLRHYMRLFIPASLFTFSIITLLESLYHLRHAHKLFAHSGHQTNAIATLLHYVPPFFLIPLTASLAVGGFWVLKRQYPAFQHAWHQATHETTNHRSDHGTHHEAPSLPPALKHDKGTQ